MTINEYNKHTKDQGLKKPKILSLARLSPLRISRDGRINHNCFPAKRSAKRDTSVSRHEVSKRLSALSNETKKKLSELRTTSAISDYVRAGSMKCEPDNLDNELRR